MTPKTYRSWADYLLDLYWSRTALRAAVTCRSGGAPGVVVNDTGHFRDVPYHMRTSTPHKPDRDRSAAIAGTTTLYIAEFAGVITRDSG